MRILFVFLCFLQILPAQAQDWSQVNGESVLLYKNGDYNSSIIKADEALKLARAQFGVESRQYMSSLSNKAYSQSALGDYLSALDNFRKTTNLSFEIYRLPHTSQIESLSELAKTFAALGTYDSAEHYINQAKYVFNSIPDQNKEHLDTSGFALSDAYINLRNLDAILLHRKGQVTAAINVLEDQIMLIKDVYPDDFESTNSYRTTLNNLSAYQNEIFEMGEAKKYALEYHRLIARDGSELELIQSLQNLGGVYNNLEDIDSASYYWHKALSLISTGIERESYLHTAILNNLGTLKLNIEEYDSAIYLLKESLRIQRSKEALQPFLYQTTLFNLAESYQWDEQYALADSIYEDLIDQLLDDIVHNFTYLSDSEKLSFYKYQLSFIDHYLSFALKISGTIPLQGSDKPYVNPNIPGALYDLQLTTKAIILNASKRMKENILDSNDTTLIKIYSLWEERKSQLAQALVNGKMDKEELKWLKVKIEEDEKWLTTNSRSFNTGFKVQKNSWQQVQQSLKSGEAAVELVRMVDGLIYAALIVTPETTQQPVMSLVMSTKSKRLDKQFYQNYYNATLHQLEDTLSYTTYWQPIIDSIKHYMPSHKTPDRIYISNDGVYNQINLNTLYDKTSRQYVIDQTEIVLVTNTKDLLKLNPNNKTKGAKKAALFGRPQFSTQQGSPVRFADLPGTGKEVELLSKTLAAARWQTKLFTAEEANEENLKALNDYTVLHLASHGFFVPATPGETNSLAETMVRSGIALAGINDIDKQNEDGLLTAFEMSGLNLDATSLVVLSACETGKGDANYGEGVYGLQRAVRVAGAQYMIMSLWKVDDTATQKLMVDFYQRWMKKNDMKKAFRSAQLALREEYPNPYFWGAFILTGN